MCITALTYCGDQEQNRHPCTIALETIMVKGPKGNETQTWLTYFEELNTPWAFTEYLNLSVYEAIQGVVIFWAGWHKVDPWSQSKVKALSLMIQLKSRKKEKSNPGISPTWTFLHFRGMIDSERASFLPFESVIFIILSFSDNWSLVVHTTCGLSAIGRHFKYKYLPAYCS